MPATIFAPSTGMPPAAISIVRISGGQALEAAAALAGILPPPREARVRALRDPTSGALLDRAMVLVFAAPSTATGEDLVELHLHGGRAVVAAVEAALAALPGLRRAGPGEFTRRALANGRIDLAEAEGLADMLAAETEAQRRAAVAMADGAVSRRIAGWRGELLELAARIEAALDFADEDDVPEALLTDIRGKAIAVEQEMAEMLVAPSVERLRDGIRVVLAGPPNSGKSSLLNALVQREAAIVSDIAGTTRDRIEVSVSRDGLPFVLSDTAGLRETSDAIEAVGVARAEEAIEVADIVLWLGDDAPSERGMLWLHTQSDIPDRKIAPSGTIASISIFRPDSVERVWRIIVEQASRLVPGPTDLAMNARQMGHCREALEALCEAHADDELVVAEALRRANDALACITGDVGIEAMLDNLFGRFCIGK